MEYGSGYERQVADRPSKADSNTKHLDMGILFYLYHTDGVYPFYE